MFAICIIKDGDNKNPRLSYPHLPLELKPHKLGFIFNGKLVKDDTTVKISRSHINLSGERKEHKLPLKFKDKNVTLNIQVYDTDKLIRFSYQELCHKNKTLHSYKATGVMASFDYAIRNLNNKNKWRSVVGHSLSEIPAELFGQPDQPSIFFEPNPNKKRLP